MTQQPGRVAASESTNLDTLPLDFDGGSRRQQASARFFVRIGQVGQATASRRCPFTAELFGIAEYLRCEGLLAADARHLAA